AIGTAIQAVPEGPLSRTGLNVALWPGAPVLTCAPKADYRGVARNSSYRFRLQRVTRTPGKFLTAWRGSFDAVQRRRCANSPNRKSRFADCVSHARVVSICLEKTSNASAI